MKRKKGKRRKTNPRILILVEGETERNYFLAIKQDPDYKKRLSALTVEIRKSKRQASEKLVRQILDLDIQAKKEENPYDSIWLVFDHDNNPKRKRAWDAALTATPKINLAFSAMAFEQWYLLHYRKSAKPFSNAINLIKALKKYMPSYEKAKQNDFLLLKSKLDTATQNADWLRVQSTKYDKHTTDQNPWTNVDLLVHFLRSL